jgi:DNA-binding transcriptional LysR family regulator
MYEIQGVDWRRRIHIVDYFPIAREIVANSNAIGVVAVQYAASAPWFSEKFEILRDAKLFTSPSQLCFATRTRWKPPPVVRALISALRETLPAA